MLASVHRKETYLRTEQTPFSLHSHLVFLFHSKYKYNFFLLLLHFNMFTALSPIPPSPLFTLYHSFIRCECGRPGKYRTIWAHGAWVWTWTNDNSFYAPMVTSLRKECLPWIVLTYSYVCLCLAFGEWIWIKTGKQRRTQMGLNSHMATLHQKKLVHLTRLEKK